MYRINDKQWEQQERALLDPNHRHWVARNGQRR